MDPFSQFASHYTGMGNDPVNMIDPSGGWSAGLSGAVIGAAVGFAAPWAIEAVTGQKIKNKGLWGIGGAFLGAGLGYAAGETLFPQIGYEASFGNNFAAFYKGLFGGTPGDLVKLKSRVCGPNTVGAIIPDLYGWIDNIKWTTYSKTIAKETLFMSLKMRDLIDNPNVQMGFPSYQKSVPVKDPQHGQLKVKFEKPIPDGYSNNISGLEPNSSSINFSILPDLKRIINYERNAQKNGDVAGYLYLNNREKTYANAVQETNSIQIHIFQVTYRTVEKRALSIFGFKIKL